MIYKAVFNSNYLCHFNKNHSSKNGQFVSGDGDGDGVVDDHAHRSKKSKITSKNSKKPNGISGGGGGSTGLDLNELKKKIDAMSEEERTEYFKKLVNSGKENILKGLGYSIDDYVRKLSSMDEDDPRPTFKETDSTSFGGKTITGLSGGWKIIPIPN